VVRGGIGAAGERAGERRQPRADRREAEELEAGEGDEAGGEEHHSGGEEDDAENGCRAEAAAEARDAEARGDDREERQAEAGGGEVVHHDADGDRDQPDDREVHAGGHDGDAEGSGGAAARRGGEDRDGEDTVRREEETGYDRRAVEDVAGQVVERAELREVQLPPQRVARGEDRQDDAGGECGHGTVAEVVGMVTSPMSRQGRARDRGDAQAFG
jgi:hypothetical protein